MNNKFTVKTTLTKKLCMDCAKYIIWHNPVFICFLIIGVLLLATLPGYILLGHSFSKAFSLSFGFIPGLALTAAILAAPWFIGKKMYQQNGDITLNINFNEDGLIINNSHKIMKIAYNDIKKVQQTNKYFFISTRSVDTTMYVLDKNTFIIGTAADFNIFIQQKLRS